MDPAFTHLRAKIAARASWAKTAYPVARTAPTHAGLMVRFEREVDPEGVLDPEDRARRAESARKAHYARMALKCHKARRLRRQAAALEAEVTAESVEDEVA